MSQATYELKGSHITPVWEAGLTGFSQSSGHLILSGVDVTGSPATLGPESHQSLDQDLGRGGNGVHIYMKWQQKWGRQQRKRCTADRMRGRTAVWAVMWVQPTILAPASGFSPWALFLKEIRADMSAGEQTEPPSVEGQLLWAVTSAMQTSGQKRERGADFVFRKSKIHPRASGRETQTWWIEVKERSLLMFPELESRWHSLWSWTALKLRRSSANCLGKNTAVWHASGRKVTTCRTKFSLYKHWWSL